jgi:HPt (histidine-containing phosphotransfer) domain-containing protein
MKPLIFTYSFKRLEVMKDLVMNETNNESHSNFDALEKLFDGDEQSLREIFAIFLQDVPKNMKNIRVDCEGGDWAAAARKVHQLKPFYGYAGSKEMELLVEELQHDLLIATYHFSFEKKLTLLEVKTESIIEMLRDRFN